MEVKGFYIRSNGDPSVGIFSAQWELRNDFVFDDIEDLEYFRSGLARLLGEHCGERCYVQTFEEWAEQIKLEEKMCSDAQKEENFISSNPVLSDSLPFDLASHPDTEADGHVFCGKCGKEK